MTYDPCRYLLTLKNSRSVKAEKVIFHGNGHGYRVQILDEVVYISHNANTLWKLIQHYRSIYLSVYLKEKVNLYVPHHICIYISVCIYVWGKWK